MRCSGRVSLAMAAAATLLAIGCGRSSPPVVDATEPATPAEVFALTCAHCHASGLAAAPQAGVPADWIARDTLAEDVLVERVIAGHGHMPPLGSCSWCTRAQLRGVLALMLAGTETAERPAGPPAEAAP